jgi:hypothetical protein
MVDQKVEAAMAGQPKGEEFVGLFAQQVVMRAAQPVVSPETSEEVEPFEEAHRFAGEAGEKDPGLPHPQPPAKGHDLAEDAGGFPQPGVRCLLVWIVKMCPAAGLAGGYPQGITRTLRGTHEGVSPERRSCRMSP